MTRCVNVNMKRAAKTRRRERRRDIVEAFLCIGRNIMLIIEG